MSTVDEKSLTYFKKMTAELRHTRQRLRAAEEKLREPVAVVGLGCRFPGGVRSGDDLWDLVMGGVDAVGPFPRDRGWDLEELFGGGRGSTYMHEGGFLAEATEFDAGFFGISPREATAMDPQQRLVLEVAWEALENAGIIPSTLAKSDVGVYIGASQPEYGPGLDRAPEGYAGHLATGKASSVLSGRVAYFLGLSGPAVTVDTACSSSLVALHLAAQALRQGDCSLALTGGVCVATSAGIYPELSALGSLAPDGRCKSFGAGADGTGWAEGVGVLVVERLSDAVRAGHRVLAVVDGSAVNQDGASNGLSAPNGLAQQDVIRRALARAELRPDDVDVVEAHGTGTALGDPVEADALLASYGRDRDRPLYLGSLKSNIGHAQAAAGVGGVIKMVMALRHGVLPRSLHCDELSSEVDWSAGGVEVLRRTRPWPQVSRPRRAGVSSFGVSGTNAHVILSQAPAPEDTEPPARETPAAIPFPLSGRSVESLRAQAEQLGGMLESRPDADLLDVGCSLATTRTMWTERAVVLAADRDELVRSLDALAKGEDAPDAVCGTPRDGKLAFVFPGQGTQRVGMGKQLYDSYPVFASAIDAIDAELKAHLDVSIRHVLFEDRTGLIEQTGYAQPALFALEVALFRLMESWGITPDFVSGHSLGEIVAAHVAGVLSFTDACTLVAGRVRLVKELARKGGAMAAVRASEETVAAVLNDGVTIAAINGPESVVISGDAEAVAEAVSTFTDQDIKTKTLAAEFAGHSPHMDAVLAEFRTITSGLTYHAPRIPIVSNLTGTVIPAAEIGSPDHWVRHLRQPVRFLDGIRTLEAEGVAAFVELGPDGGLSSAAHDCVADPEAADFVPALRPNQPEPRTAMAVPAHLHVKLTGDRVPWDTVFAGTNARIVDLPTYPFEHRKYWLPADSGADDLTRAGLDPVAHPMLAAGVTAAGSGELLFMGRVSAETHPWLLDHALNGSVVMPGVGFVELVSRAGEQVDCGHLVELTHRAPLVLPETGSVRIQVALGAADDTGRRSVDVHAYQPDHADDPWKHLATGAVGPEPGDTAGFDLAAWPPAGAEPIDLDDFYADLGSDLGVYFGPSFQGLRTAWRRGDEIFTEVVPSQEPGPDADGYHIHPSTLDSVLHGFRLAHSDTVRVPFSWSDVRFFGDTSDHLRVRLTPTGTESMRLRIADEQGRAVAQVGSLAMRRISVRDFAATDHEGLFRIDWVATEPAKPVRRRDWCRSDVPALPGPDERVPAIVVVPAPDNGSTQDVLAATLALTRTWLAERRFGTSRLVFAVDGDGPANAAVAGLIRAARAEHPGRFGVLRTRGALDADETSAALAALAAGETEVRVRDRRVEAPRLARIGAGTGEPGAPLWTADDTVLITGGTGTLGGLLARHLVTAHGVRNLVLVSRSGPDADGAAELTAELTEHGARVRIEACDVSRREPLADLLASVPADRPLRGVIHIAGGVDDAMLENLDPQRIERVMRGKADAAAHLDALTADLNLRAFVLYSSISGVLGTPGQANYCAANSYLDELARDRRRRDLPAVSLAWGLWDSVKDTTKVLTRQDIGRINRTGVAALSAPEGLALFDAALRADEPVMVTARLDYRALRQADAANPVPRLFRKLVPANRKRHTPATAAPREGADLRRELVSASDADRRRIILTWIGGHVASVLRRSDADLRPNQTFREMGFDSLTAVEMRNRISAVLGIELPANFVFEHPTPAELTSAIAGLADEITVTGDTTVESRAEPAPIPSKKDDSEPGGDANLVDLYVRACVDGRYAEALEPAKAMAAFRPKFSRAEELDLKLEPVPLTEGREEPMLVCIPPFIWRYTSRYYSAVMARFRRQRTAVMLDLPGYRNDQLLPASGAVLAEVLANAVRNAVGGSRFVMLGHSGGAVIAAAVTAELERTGTKPDGLVLIDLTKDLEYAPGSVPKWAPEACKTLANQHPVLLRMERRLGHTAYDDAWVTAQAQYSTLDFSVSHIDAPTLLVRAVDPPAGIDPVRHGWEIGWHLEHTMVDTTGDHSSMMFDHAGECGRHIDDWLRELPAAKESA